FLLANIVYQGYAGGVEIDAIRRVGEVAVAGVMPTCVFLLDMDPLKARLRMGEVLDRMESRGDDYRQQLRAGFLQEAKRLGSAVHIVDADRPVDEVQSELRH